MLTRDPSVRSANVSDVLDKYPLLNACEDYQFLRRKGIEYIERMGSREWTDYNSHDPGITILEALCYAITELGFRAGMDIKDMLAEQPAEKRGSERQAFFTAREILTVNPLTLDDYRRLLIDLDQVRNAWLIPKKCPCEVQLYADSRQDSLRFEHPHASDNDIPVTALGTYDVLLELDTVPELGDLNETKVSDNYLLKRNADNFVLTVELRFPAWDNVRWGAASDYIAEAGKIAGITIGASLFKSDQPVKLTQDEQNRRWRQWFRVFYLDVTVTLENARSLHFGDVPLKFFGRSELSRTFKDEWDFSDIKPAFFITLVESYIKKTTAVENSLAHVTEHLNEHRNLCEDFCSLTLACIEEVAVCADIDLSPDADIERVLANVLFEIERYFSPGLKFYTLAELLDEGMPVDEIFDGPKLEHGFIKSTDLAAAQLKPQIRTSDMINRLVEIDGVLAVKNLLLTRYDAFGQPVEGVADGGAVKDKISASWTLEISERCRPKLYVDHSRFIFFKNGLPFTARASEVQDTLNELRGRDERMKIRNLTIKELDLPVPVGVYRPLTQYHPVQYTLPLTYGTGFEGVRLPATEKRRAQAKQLKAYLMVYEQLLANAFAQMSHVGDLFSVDENQLQTYFFNNLRNEAVLSGVTELVKSDLDTRRLQELTETEAERIDRRNRALDHLLARFAENFSEYAMLLRSIGSNNKTTVDTGLIKHKIAFLKDYPLISRERNKSFNYLASNADRENQAVLRKRIALVLGMKPEQEQHIILVEHLLLRPKFPGDALMPICLENAGSLCVSGADPYSFQLTMVMPGWQQPFTADIELRRFIDRTIRLEVPAHLLVRVCWVSNLQYGEGWDDQVLDPLSAFLRENGKNAGSNAPTAANAKNGALKLLQAAKPVYNAWMKSTAVKHANADELRTQLSALFKSDMPPLAALYGGVKNYGEIGESLYRLLADHFAEVTQSDQWFQFHGFQKAWQSWLRANAQFNWQHEKVLPKIESAFEALGISRRDSTAGQRRVCQVAEHFGALFSREMKRHGELDNVFETETARNNEIERIVALAFTDEDLSRFGIALKHKETLSLVFTEIYIRYIDVTLKLWKVLLRLANLNSIYPPATLHDCDDGNDTNPVRLGSTMLGG